MTPDQAIAEAREHLELNSAYFVPSVYPGQFTIKLVVPISVTVRTDDLPGKVRTSLIGLLRDLANKMSQQDWDRELAEERAEK